MPQAISTNTFGSAKWIVDPSASQGTHTTIQGAINSAASGDTIFVRPGTYTENLALKAGVNITAYDVNAGSTSSVTLVGKMTYSSAGTVALGGMTFQTNGDFILVVSGANAAVITMENCILNATNNTAISHTAANASSSISISDCTGDISNVGITLFVSTSTGSISISESTFGNSGSSVTPSSSSAGFVGMNFCHIFFALLSTGTSNFNFSYCGFFFSAGIPITLNGTTGHAIRFSQVFTGAFASVSVGAGSQLNTTVCSYGSAGAANIISGAGTVFYDNVNTQGYSGTINAASNTGGPEYVGSLSFDGGTNNLSTFTNWTSFTPTVTGATAAGVTVYATQTGQYSRIGNIVVVNFDIVTVSSTGTGDALLSGLPFTINNSLAIAPFGSIQLSNLTWPVGGTSLSLFGLVNTTTAKVLVNGTAFVGGFLQMANVAFAFRGTIVYRV